MMRGESSREEKRMKGLFVVAYSFFMILYITSVLWIQYVRYIALQYDRQNDLFL